MILHFQKLSKTMEATRPCLTSLPTELKKIIVGHLGLSSLLSLSATNKELHQLCTEAEDWFPVRCGGSNEWGEDSDRLLTKLEMERFSKVTRVDICSRYGETKSSEEWLRLMTAMHCLPKLLSVNLDCDLTGIEPWLFADMISSFHCVQFEMCWGITKGHIETLVSFMKDPTCVTRHLRVHNVDLSIALSSCQDMLSALKFLWCFEVDERCLGVAQHAVLREGKERSLFICRRRDFNPQKICRYHNPGWIKAKEQRDRETRAEFEALWNEARSLRNPIVYEG